MCGARRQPATCGAARSRARAGGPAVIVTKSTVPVGTGDEIARIMGYWMELGLSGFRVDAVPFLIEATRPQDKLDLPDPHDYLADLAAFLRRRNGESVLLGEVNLPYPDLMPFFGARDGGGSTDELTMCFDFIGMQMMYLSLARGDAEPLADALRRANAIVTSITRTMSGIMTAMSRCCSDRCCAFIV